MINKFHEVLNFNQLFLKLNRFICNEQAALLIDWCVIMSKQPIDIKSKQLNL